jgi:hypothetical protein
MTSPGIVITVEEIYGTLQAVPDHYVGGFGGPANHCIRPGPNQDRVRGQQPACRQVLIILLNFVAGGPGFEPRMPGSEPGVLPLNYPPGERGRAQLPRPTGGRNGLLDQRGQRNPFKSWRRGAARGLAPEPNSTSREVIGWP